MTKTLSEFEAPINLDSGLCFDFLPWKTCGIFSFRTNTYDIKNYVSVEIVANAIKCARHYSKHFTLY